MSTELITTETREAWLEQRKAGIGRRCKCGCGRIPNRNTGFCAGHEADGECSTVQDRFLKFVCKTSGCWMWTGAVNANGYGSFMLDGKAQTASRIAYSLFVGPIPDGLHALHHCDTPLCVNPSHLFLGTNGDNVADRVQKGRQRGAVGENNCKAKITREMAVEIRALHQSRVRTGVIARQFGLHRTTVQRIVSGRYWK